MMAFAMDSAKNVVFFGLEPNFLNKNHCCHGEVGEKGKGVKPEQGRPDLATAAQQQQIEELRNSGTIQEVRNNSGTIQKTNLEQFRNNAGTIEELRNKSGKIRNKSGTIPENVREKIRKQKIRQNIKNSRKIEEHLGNNAGQIPNSGKHQEQFRNTSGKNSGTIQRMS